MVITLIVTTNLQGEFFDPIIDEETKVQRVEVKNFPGLSDSLCWSSQPLFYSASLLGHTSLNCASYQVDGHRNSLPIFKMGLMIVPTSYGES